MSINPIRKTNTFDLLKSKSFWANEYNINGIDSSRPYSEGIFIKPSKLYSRGDITGFVLSAVDNDGKITWDKMTLNKLHDVDLLGLNDGDTIKWNKQENLWVPTSVNNLSGGDAININGNIINFLFDEKQFIITSENKLTLKTNPVVLIGSEGINVVTTINQSGQTLANISVDNNILKTTGNQLKSGDLEINGMLNAEIVSDGFITINSGDIENVTSLSFMENNGENDQITIMAPMSVETGGYTLKLPSKQGSVNDFLVNDGAGNLSWKQGGTSVTPGGNNGSIQFKDSLDKFAGSNNFTYDGNHVNLINGQMYAGAFNANSDLNLKKNIEPLSNCLDKINKIDVYKYNWKETSEKSFGVIAQQLENIGLEHIVKTNNGIKSVNYNELVSILIGAVKELNKKINTEEKNKHLKKN